RGAGADDDDRRASIRYLLRDRPLVIFLCCAVLFHFANAAMLPLLGEMLAKGRGRSSMMFMSACVVTTQFTITLNRRVGWPHRGHLGQKTVAAPGIQRAARARDPLYADQ
ncbi:MAG: hypothetical protein WAN81_14295, partial [Candidatus Binataceae bacterium]